MPRRRCSECSNPLPPDCRSDKKTCSINCRDKRTRRLARGRKQQGVTRKNGPHADLQDIARGEVKNAVSEVAKAELTPIVREAITEDVLAAVSSLVALTPRMVAAIGADLDHPDDTVRQRAYTLLAKLTINNASVAPASAEVAPPAMQVVFAMPRPGDTTAGDPEAPDVVELRTCRECETERPSDEFVAGSERCVDCHAALQAKVAERFA